MRTALNIVGILLALMGFIWILQGTSVLPGSFMTGDMKWAVYGSVLVVVGIILLMNANRRRG